MKTYAIVNEKERVVFEKEYQIPFGYANAPLFDKLSFAIAYHELLPDNREDYVIEECESGFTTTVYRL